MVEYADLSPEILFTPDELADLEKVGNIIRYPPGSILLGEGEQTDFALLIRSGHVKILSEGTIMALRGPDDIIGEMAAFRRKARTATVQAIDDVVALYLPAPTWLTFLWEHPRALFAQVFVADERLEETDCKRVESFLGAEQKLAKALVELHDKLGVRKGAGVVLGVSQQELAAIAGVSRESVVQVMRQLKAASIVSIARRATTILDPERLAKIADGSLIAAQD